MTSSRVTFDIVPSNFWHCPELLLAWSRVAPHVVPSLCGQGAEPMRLVQEAYGLVSFDEYWDVGFIYRSGNGLSTSIVLTCTIVCPSFLVLGQVGLPLFDTRFCDGADEQGRTKHVFILLLKSFWVVGKVEDEGAHDGIALFGYTLSTLLNVRTQTFAFF